MDTEKKRINPAIISIIVVVLIGIAAGAVYAATSAKQTSTSDETTGKVAEQTTSSDQTTSTEQSAATDSSTSTDTASTYADGTYSATGNYSTPGGTESITVTVTLAGDTISSVSAKGSASRGDSSQYQAKFLSGYKSQVVGKDIDSVSLSRVSGSSLTSNGFNAAIEKIKDEAVS